jgi:hypothetical protein
MPIWTPEREIELAPVPPPQTSEIYPESYWECDQDHKFWRGQVRQPNPSRCPVCDSKMVRWVPVGPQF